MKNNTKKRLFTIISDGQYNVSLGDIVTAEVYGKMDDGTTVWMGEDGKQYQCIRICGKQFFISL